MNLVTCKKCGWVHMVVSRSQAEAEVKTFNAFFESASQATKDCYGNRPSSLVQYKYCSVCGVEASKETFRPFKKGDCPRGVTIGPIIYE